MDFDLRSLDESRHRDIDRGELNQGSRGGLSNPRERERLEPRDVFTRDLELPRGRARQRVWAGDSDVMLRGSEVRTLATHLVSLMVAGHRDRPRRTSGLRGCWLPLDRPTTHPSEDVVRR